ncbi:MAG: SDR family oxidoreductase [Clostridia bacterium]|nr:SDR family oxidoreductase [Clostridia bacterium]
MDYGLKDKRVLVTGSAGGLGKTLAKVFDEEGAYVILHGREAEKELLEGVLSELSRGEYFMADFSDEESVENLWKQVGAVDILVNNAGIWPTAYVKDMTSDQFRKTLEINLIAPFILSRNFLNERIASGKKGKIINLVSQAAFHGSTSGHAHYAASKAGMVGFTVSMAREAAPLGINVNAVAPGMMRTPMNKDALEQREDAYLERIPLRRIADPSEVAYAVVYLASNKADYITGATLDVTGGMLMR